MTKRTRFQQDRQGKTHSAVIVNEHGEATLTITYNRLPNGLIGEVFVKCDGRHSAEQDAWATCMSIGLQYGVPVDCFCKKFAFMRDDTGGMVKEGHPDIQICHSRVDYVARWLAKELDLKV